MSQYLTSLIEPIARQARRFSSSNNLEPSENVGPPTAPATDELHLNHRDALASTTLIAHQSQSTRIPINQAPDAITAGARLRAPTLGGRYDDIGLQTSPNEDSDSGFISAVEVDNPGTDASTRLPTVQVGVNRSINTTHVNSNRFESNTPSSSHSSRSALNENVSPANVSTPAFEFAVRDRAGSQNSRSGEGSLPADDGMGHLRNRILAIQRAESSNEVKARLVHDLMTEKHNSSQQSLHVGYGVRARSPASFQSSDQPITPSSPESTNSLRRLATPSTPPYFTANVANPMQLSAEDLEPTYFEKPSPAGRDGENERRLSESDEDLKALGCAHYKRNIKLQCSVCQRWYTCRFCHDAVEDHMLNRRETKNMLCMICGCAQPASEQCVQCSERGAWYYCDVCKLWDDDLQKSIYHCEDCGICRIGQGLGKDFFHCKTCCVCMAIAIRDSHRCIERSTDCDCPICGEYMFTSPQTVVFMRCSHSIHSRCFWEHMRTSYRCPICSRSVVNTEWQFIKLSRLIESQPMPPEFQDTKAWVSCNDCNAKSSVKYHWLGLRCGVCDSYNTAQLRILTGPDVNANRPQSPDQSTQAGGLSQPITSLSRTTSRGRSRLPHNSSRSGVSAPPTASARNYLESPRHARSVGPTTASAFQIRRSSSASNLGDSMNNDDSEFSEVDFWGGGSPRNNPTSALAQQQERKIPIDNDNNDDEDDGSNSGTDSGFNEVMNGTDDWEDDGVEVDGMELLGHR